MSVVGAFPGITNSRRRMIRGPVNPLDKSTIVSIYPKEIDEVKHTISPGRFIISPGSIERPSVLVVGPSSWWREIDEDQPLLEIPTSSILIADSIVKDYCNGILGCDMAGKMPGLFYIPGEVDYTTLKTKFKDELEKAAIKQKAWYAELVKMADSLWARSNGNPLAISDDMRLAARELSFNSKDWLKDHQMVEMVRCHACGSLKNPQYPVCSTCRAVDSTNPQAKNIKFAS